MPDENFVPAWATDTETLDVPGIRLSVAPAGGIFLVAGRGTPMPSVVGLPWPDAPGPWAGEDPGVTLIAPNRWLLACTETRHDTVAAELAALQAAQLAYAHDVGDGRVWFTVSGPRAEELLNSGIAVDLHAARVPTGTALSVQLSRVPVLLHRCGSDAFRLLADASCTSYLRAWFHRNMPLVASVPR